MEVGRELRHQLDQRVVDDLIGAVVPTRKLALLRWSQKKLWKAKKKTNNDGNRQKIFSAIPTNKKYTI